MLVEGPVPGLRVLVPVEIRGPWEELATTADAWSTEASGAAEGMDSAAAAWQGLLVSYQEPATQDVVWSAFDQVPQVVQEWSDLVGRALNSQWEQLEQQTASDLDRIGSGGGLEEDIPQVTADGGGFGAVGGFQVPGVVLAGGFFGGGIGGGARSALVDGLVSLFRGDAGSGDVERAGDLFESIVDAPDDASAQDVEDLYDQLALMSPEQIAEFAENNPSVNYKSLPIPSSQEQLDNWVDGTQWWDSVSEDEEQVAALREDLPLLVGNTEGVPSEVRHTANVAAMNGMLAMSQQLRNFPSNQTRRLEDIKETLDEGNDDRMLLSLNVGQQDRTGPGEPSGPDPLAAISVGNPDEADSTHYNVPGMGSNTDSISDEVRRAQEQHDEQQGSNAYVSWLGYDAPNNVISSAPAQVMDDELADQGGWALAHALDGHRDTLDNAGRSDARVTVNAHSYGTNTASFALSRTTHDVDAVIFYGSAGISPEAVTSADDLHVKDTEEGNPAVFVTHAINDGVAKFGVLGGDGWLHRYSQILPMNPLAKEFYGAVFQEGDGRVDPAAETFGAYVFSSDGGGNIPGEPVSGHGQNYFDEEYMEGYLDVRGQSGNTILRIQRDGWQGIDFISDADGPTGVDPGDGEREVEEPPRDPFGDFSQENLPRRYGGLGMEMDADQ